MQSCCECCVHALNATKVGCDMCSSGVPNIIQSCKGYMQSTMVAHSCVIVAKLNKGSLGMLKEKMPHD